MRIEVLSDNCRFAFIPELEPLWGALSVLSGESIHTLCTELYGAERISAWKRQYSFLFETFKVADPLVHMNIFDYLLEMPLESISLRVYRDYLLIQPAEKFVWRYLNLDFFCKGADTEMLRKAISDDAALDEMYGCAAEWCDSFLAFSAFVRQSRRFITELFELAEQMQTPALAKALDKQAQSIEQMLSTVRSGADGDLLELSQQMMGKTFRNRGPYDEFIFIPSYLMPLQACRYFDVGSGSRRQILFLTLRQTGRGSEEKVRALKAIADPTRYQILTILAQEGPMRGLDIAKRVGVATSTISHHMDQMKESGLITEEPVKNSKYYGLSKQSAKTLLEDIAKDFAIE